jgi:hypothetical protein
MGLKRLPARFYRSDSGREPVREWLKGLESADRRIIGEDIKEIEFAWPIGMPLVRSLGRRIWEVRSSLPHGRISRVLFLRRAGLHGAPARLHEEDPEDTRAGHRTGAETNEGKH